YLRGALALDDRDRVACLLYFFKHLDSPDPDVAADAFLEFAKASDQEIGAVGPKLDPGKLRKLLADPKTPPERLGVFAFLLGACGTKADADTLLSMASRTDDRTSGALSGILGGLIEMRPADGWKTAAGILEDPKRSYGDKLAVLGTLRFYHAYKPADHRKPILAGMAGVIAHGDMADMAVEDLRRWKWWGLSGHVLAQFAKSTHAAPLVRNAIVRYALTCPDADAAAFIKKLRGTDPDLIREVEESLEFERPTPPPKSKQCLLPRSASPPPPSPWPRSTPTGSWSACRPTDHPTPRWPSWTASWAAKSPGSAKRGTSRASIRSWFRSSPFAAS